MSHIAHPDHERIEKLRQWLESRGVDVVQVGDDLAMPSPFKEREKRRTEGPGYVDTKRRLWVTVVTGDDGKPKVRWQCWWSKSVNGKGLGGHSVYAVAMAARCGREEINKLLGLEIDEEVEKAEGVLEKALAILWQGEREKIAKEKSIKAENERPGRISHELPKNFEGLFEGSFITKHAESMVLARGIQKEVSLAYKLCWDIEKEAVFIPWLNREGKFQFGQWWDGERYRFPRKDGIHFQKEDGIFGIHLYNGKRLVLSEGCFTAMSITGMALGGSSLTDEQMATILSLSPEHIVLAFDNDNGGYYGSKAIHGVLKSKLPNAHIDITMPPRGFNDWNDVLKKNGINDTMKEFVERIGFSRKMGAMAALAVTYAPQESTSVRS
jgi:hypothetical protein